MAADGSMAIGDITHRVNRRKCAKLFAIPPIATHNISFMAHTAHTQSEFAKQKTNKMEKYSKNEDVWCRVGRPFLCC